MRPICHPFRVGNILINLFCYYDITPFGVIEIADGAYFFIPAALIGIKNHIDIIG